MLLEKECNNDKRSIFIFGKSKGKRHGVYCVGEKLCLSRTLGDHNHQIGEFWLYMDGSMMFQRNNSSGLWLTIQ
ncbi:hypothetical protein H5410_059692 [Solanum commersonii]|uniref:Uncharacterized protein n=1 Tax=Solanum commersonii TaxID=4109 RepID=A0A9J5W487_SOLCO|nr:hypothetical protein H5410_059692 [Solanum commersonii]